MKMFDESKLNKILRDALVVAIREFQKQNKDVRVTSLSVTHDILNPPGISYHIVADMVTLLSPQATDLEGDNNGKRTE